MSSGIFDENYVASVLYTLNDFSKLQVQLTYNVVFLFFGIVSVSFYLVKIALIIKALIISMYSKQ